MTFSGAETYLLHALQGNTFLFSYFTIHSPRCLQSYVLAVPLLRVGISWPLKLYVPYFCLQFLHLVIEKDPAGLKESPQSRQAAVTFTHFVRCSGHLGGPYRIDWNASLRFVTHPHSNVQVWVFANSVYCLFAFSLAFFLLHFLQKFRTETECIDVTVSIVPHSQTIIAYSSGSKCVVQTNLDCIPLDESVTLTRAPASISQPHFQNSVFFMRSPYYYRFPLRPLLIFCHELPAACLPSCFESRVCLPGRGARVKEGRACCAVAGMDLHVDILNRLADFICKLDFIRNPTGFFPAV